MRAAQVQSIPCMKILAQWGAHVNQYAHVQLQMQKDPLVRLRRIGLGQRKRNDGRESSLAVFNDDPNVGADDLVLDGPLGCTALILSTYSNGRDAINVTRLLLNLKADVTCPQYDGKTALHVAAQSGAVSSLALIVEAPTTPKYALHCVDSAGNSPLLLAAEFDQRDVIKYVGTRPEIHEKLVVPRTYAPNGWKGAVGPTEEVQWPPRIGGGYDISTPQVAADRGYGLNLCNSQGMSAVAIAAAMDHQDCAWSLIQAGADLNLSGGSALAALIIAIEEGNYKLTKLLLDNGADQVIIDTVMFGLVDGFVSWFSLLRRFHVSLCTRGRRVCWLLQWETLIS